MIVPPPTVEDRADLRLGFLGVGWIGRHRMKAMLDAGGVQAAAVADPSPAHAQAAAELAPSAERVDTLDQLLELELDGVVIATPSALHAQQAIAALEGGTAVFCQKPLGRSADETRQVIAAARSADQLLGVDLSYRFTHGMQLIKALIQSGELGPIFAAELTFHNAYGPDKSWFYDPAQSGGGCVIDLGTHLVDLALWLLDFPQVDQISSTLFAGGERLKPRPDRVEDYALATLELQGGSVARIACSWNLAAGSDAVISAAVYGVKGGAQMRNLNGSFYDFTTEQYQGQTRRTLADPPEDWGGRAAVDWAARLAAGARFDPAVDHLVDVAKALDGIYGR